MPSVLSTLEELFSEHNMQTQSVNYDQPVDVVNFPTVHRADSEPITLIWPDIERGPWIAGGAPLRWWQGLPVGESDIDVFCANQAQAEVVIERIKEFGRWQRKYDSENATTLSYWSKNDSSKVWTIQIIKRRYFGSLEEVISNFDMTVCEIGTCGNNWVLGRQTARDIRERNLRMNLPLTPDALKRMVKYWAYGYRPVPGLLEAVQNNPIAKWEFALDEDYNNAF
jgi:hypothetical protein